jgi:hypothetical protein
MFIVIVAGPQLFQVCHWWVKPLSCKLSPGDERTRLGIDVGNAVAVAGGIEVTVEGSGVGIAF